MVPTRWQSEDLDPAPLGRPLHFEFSGQTAQNRFLKAAMTERLSSWDPKNLPKRGVPSKNLVNDYRRWGEGETGLILTGNIMIDYDQLEAPGNSIIPEDAPFSGERFEAFNAMATEAKKHGSLVVGQVSHPGRQVEQRVQPNPISASDVQLEGVIMGLQFAKPHPATPDEISHIIHGFTHAAEYLHKAGYHGIELHGAHGYLLAQFLSQTTNKRTDQYGGGLRNRSRLILEIAQSIRTKIPASTGFMLGIKLNSVEFQESGFSPEDCRELVQLLEQEGQFDFVELSGGTYQSLAFVHKRESTRRREAFFIEFAETIVPGLSKTKVYVTGGLRTVGAMVQALDTVDGVGLGRPLCQEFDLPKKILSRQVKGAIRPVFNEDDFGLANVVAGTQIRQVGNDQQPFDASDEESVEAFQKDMGAWMQGVQEDAATMNKYGYVDVVSLHASPYGIAAGSGT